MRLSAATGLVLGLVLIGCTSPSTVEAPDSSVPSPAQSEPPSSVPTSDIQFLLRDTYAVGDRIPVRIENVGDAAYRYQFIYQACFLSYFDSEGREFIIPPGTHCDILSEAVIQPGETVRLFMWDLDECIKDNWGCSKARPLDPGTYAIRGAFRPVGKGHAVRARVTFEIQA
jgi:hypothetical protein